MRTILMLLAMGLATTAHAADETNYLTFGAGAVIVRADPAAERIGYVAIDGSRRTLSAGTPKREPLPLTIVIELPALTTLSRFEVPVINEFGPAKGRHIETLRIEGSTQSATEGFAPLVEIKIASGTDQAQRFPVAAPKAVRWVRVTFVDRQAPPPSPVDPHHFSELEGYGKQDPIAPAVFDGHWRFRRKGLNDTPGRNIIELRQNGTEVKGCQRLGGKHTIISGAIVDGMARLIAEDDKGKRSPFTAVVLSDGQLAGVEFEGPPSAFYAAPDPTAESACAVPPPTNPVADALVNGETATLYGIHFDVNSDVLRADAEPALQQLLEALRSVPKLAAVIEGHTDADGTDSHNQDLSERRAKAVVAWLVAHGIEAARLSPVGRGESKPIADNDTSAGRALNRRVEVAARK